MEDLGLGVDDSFGWSTGSTLLILKLYRKIMIIYLDAHLHSPYSRATSKEMSLENLSRNASLKGLNLLGSSDFTHPTWFKILKNKLKEVNNTGIYQNKDGFNFILSTEISSIYSQDKIGRRVHNIILAPHLDIVEQINSELSKHGRLDYDGRPIFGFSCIELVEMMRKIDKNIEIIPSHCLTPWFSVFGSKSGFDTVGECFGDQAKYIHALETGLSADPSMIHRVSKWDEYSLVSFSDSHSPWPWRIGRECCVFDLKEITFENIISAIKNKDKKGFLMTIEFPPEGGKYHFTGHRNCNVSLSPKDSIKINDICPVCKRKLTVGVEQRVEELADRPKDYTPKDAVPFKTLLPLYEIISFVSGSGELYSKKVLIEHDRLIEKFGNELNILLNVSRKELLRVTNEKIADAIIKVREGKIKYIAGYDGTYGIPVFSEEEFENLKREQKIKMSEQRSLADFK